MAKTYFHPQILKAVLVYILESRQYTKDDYVAYLKAANVHEEFNLVKDHFLNAVEILKVLGIQERKFDLIAFLHVLPQKRNNFITYIIEAISNNVVTDSVVEYISLYPKYSFIVDFATLLQDKETSMTTTSSNQRFSLEIQFTDKLTSKEKKLLIIGFLGEALQKIGKDEYRYNNQKVDFDERFNNGILLIQDKKKVTFIKTDLGFEIATEHEGAKRFWKLLSSLSSDMIQSYTLVALKPEEPEFF